MWLLNRLHSILINSTTAAAVAVVVAATDTAILCRCNFENLPKGKKINGYQVDASNDEKGQRHRIVADILCDFIFVVRVIVALNLESNRLVLR